MTRTLATAVDSYLSEPVLDFRTLAHVTFASTTMRLHNGIGTLWVGSSDYVGVGMYGGVDKISEDANVFHNTVKLQLSAVNSAPIVSAMSEALFGNEVSLYRAWLRNGTIVNTAELWYRGQMAEVNLFRGDPDRGDFIEVTCETKLSRRSKTSFYTKSDMITAGYSGDTFFDYLHLIPSVKATWGNRAVLFDLPGIGQYERLRIAQNTLDNILRRFR